MEGQLRLIATRKELQKNHILVKNFDEEYYDCLKLETMVKNEVEKIIFEFDHELDDDKNYLLAKKGRMSDFIKTILNAQLYNIQSEVVAHLTEYNYKQLYSALTLIKVLEISEFYFIKRENILTEQTSKMIDYLLKEGQKDMKIKGETTDLPFEKEEENITEKKVV